MDPLSLNRLAVRIEGLVNQSTHDWCAGDDLEFQRGLPSYHSLDRWRLPDPKDVRAAARGEGEKEFTVEQYRIALSRCMSLEHLVSRNRPGNPRRVMQDMARGRFPGFRR